MFLLTQAHKTRFRNRHFLVRLAAWIQASVDNAVLGDAFVIGTLL